MIRAAAGRDGGVRVNCAEIANLSIGTQDASRPWRFIRTYNCARVSPSSRAAFDLLKRCLASASSTIAFSIDARSEEGMVASDEEGAAAPADEVAMAPGGGAAVASDIGTVTAFTASRDTFGS